jgi:hypothetical protein
MGVTSLQIPQALAVSQDVQHRQQQKIPAWNANASPDPGITNRLEVAD